MCGRELPNLQLRDKTRILNEWPREYQMEVFMLQLRPSCECWATPQKANAWEICEPARVILLYTLQDGCE
jgi:hypothetical protein